MTDFREDINRTTQDIARIAQDAAYVAIGLGVIGFQKAQVARRELFEQIERQRTVGEGPAADARTQVLKAWKEIDKTVTELIERADASFEPISERLPEPAQVFVKQARDARDQLRDYINQQLAA